jgi:putative two-component system response regulator
VRPIIRWHHERIDGTGYPDGLRGDAIPQVAQIVGVVEMYEALTTTRPYQQCLEAEDALTLLRRHADRGWLATPIVDGMARVVQSMSAQ